MRRHHRGTRHSGMESAVARLDDLTDRAAVERAIEEFLDLGREQFLVRHGQEGCGDYFIRVDGRLLDAKPILSVAYAYQDSEHGALSAREFSGGEETLPALARLGFQAVTRAQLNPPVIGEQRANRTDICQAYGGDWVAGISRFPGDAVVNVFSDADGPDANDPPLLGETLSLRGEGMIGPQRLSQR